MDITCIPDPSCNPMCQPATIVYRWCWCIHRRLYLSVAQAVYMQHIPCRRWNGCLGVVRSFKEDGENAGRVCVDMRSPAVSDRTEIDVKPEKIFNPATLFMALQRKTAQDEHSAFSVLPAGLAARPTVGREAHWQRHRSNLT